MASFSGLDKYRLTNVKVCETVLGTGSYATVYEVEYMGLKCASKKIHDMLVDRKNPTYQLKRYEEECKILSEVRHPNIVQFLGVFFQEGDTIPILVMERLTTNLTSCIEKNGILPADMSYSVLHDIALGLVYLHSQTPPIIHRDLSSNNVLLTASQTAKIAGLGVARIVDKTKMSPVPGTLIFMPPEVLSEGTRTYGTSIDIFSYGNIMIHIYTGKWPQPIEDEDSKTDPKWRKQILKFIPTDHPLKKLIKKCIKSKASRRPSANEILPQVSDVASKFPFAKDPLQWSQDLQEIKDENDANKSVIESLAKHVTELDENHAKSEIALQEQLKKFKDPLVTTKQPLDAIISWKECALPPTSESTDFVQSITINTKVYFGCSRSGEIHCYNLPTNAWNVLPQVDVKDFGLGRVNDQLVAVGGMYKKHNPQKLSCNLYTLTSENKWAITFKPMPTARTAATVLSIDSALLVAGGEMCDGTSTNIVELYKIETDNWYAVESLPLPTACQRMALVASSQTVYAIGGYSRETLKLNQSLATSVNCLLTIADYTYICDKMKTNWDTLENTPTYQPAATILDDNLIIIGGWETQDSEAMQEKVYIFRPATNSWIYVSDLPESLTKITCATLPSREILVVGESARDKRNKMYKGTLALQQYQ